MQDKVEASSITALMADLGKRARAAARKLGLAPEEQKNRALRAMASAVREATAAILAANAQDVETMTANGQIASFLDLGTLTAELIQDIDQTL